MDRLVDGGTARTVEGGPGPDFRVAISLQLPRDRLSVPLIRHVVGHALHEVGAVREDIDDVGLAVTEATTNVIRHSRSGDAYTVEVAIGTEAVELRVVDVGRGFDAEAIELMDAATGPGESGRGITLMRALVDQARFDSEPERGTVVHLTKRLHFTQEAPALRLTRARPPAGDAR